MQVSYKHSWALKLCIPFPTPILHTSHYCFSLLHLPFFKKPNQTNTQTNIKNITPATRREREISVAKRGRSQGDKGKFPHNPALISTIQQAPVNVTDGIPCFSVRIYGPCYSQWKRLRWCYRGTDLHGGGVVLFMMVMVLWERSWYDERKYWDDEREY